ncbi:hypothetical protein L6R50_04235 [Myxococcota bacterium]|nr:hypothetical protein [Myxococcota bacterium]
MIAKRAVGAGGSPEHPGVEGRDRSIDPVWDGRPSRIETWYATWTEPATGTGFWLHHEVVAPPRGEAISQGWAAVFPPGEAPVVERFGPEAAVHPVPEGTLFDSRAARASRGLLEGRTEGLSWRLEYADAGAALRPFPPWTFGREWFPGSQVASYPTARFSGTFGVGPRTFDLQDAPGAMSHIYAHGHAHGWTWLHADLGGGDALEIVAARPQRAALRWLPVLTFARLRVGGRDWPRDPARSVLGMRTRPGLPRWTTRGRAGDLELDVEVEVPDAASVTLAYHDPDGTPAWCTNSERASATVRAKGPFGERTWRLDGTAHAEVGTRTPPPGRVVY